MEIFEIPTDNSILLRNPDVYFVTLKLQVHNTHYIFITSFKSLSCFTNKCLAATSPDISEMAHCLEYCELFDRFVVDFQIGTIARLFCFENVDRCARRDPPVSPAQQHCCAVSKCLPRFNRWDVLVRPDAERILIPYYLPSIVASTYNRCLTIKSSKSFTLQ